jgi:hypothetical protein
MASPLGRALWIVAQTVVTFTILASLPLALVAYLVAANCWYKPFSEFLACTCT